MNKPKPQALRQQWIMRGNIVIGIGVLHMKKRKKNVSVVPDSSTAPIAQNIKRCPDGRKHKLNASKVCKRCGCRVQ